jgi:phospholipase C
MIAGQSGITEWVRHPELGSNNISTNFQLPVTGDPQPFWGSALDTYNVDSWPTEEGAPGTSSPAANQTYASLPLSFMGQNINTITSFDNNAAFDLQDVQQDITKIAGDNNAEVNWGWFQQGYDHEPTDTTATATHVNYIAHHAAPQYFGYIANNGVETQKHMFGQNDFFNTINNEQLPSAGGVFYIRGGYGNNDGLVPRSPSPAVKAAFTGNDDHPGYSDLQISETSIADSVNAIANSPYWSQSVIIITYDESDGLYDHAQPEIYNLDPKGSPLEQGPRIPAIVISPYAATHVVSHEVTNHGSIIKFIDELFNLTPLAQLPDEAAAQQTALADLGLPGYTPTDDPSLPNGDLFSAFDDGRLSGTTPPVPATYAYLPTFLLHQLPHLGGQGCSVLGITPTDYLSNGGVIDPAPADFNPRPGTNPGLPTTPGWPTN